MTNEESIKIIKDFCTDVIKRNHELQGQLLLDQEEIDDLWLAVDYIESIINRNTAEWIESDVEESVLAKCSHCGYDCGAYILKFCPNCGARMKGSGINENHNNS